MSRLLHVLAALAVSAPSFAADKKVEDAFAKAESQLAKGRTDEAEKTMEKLVQQLPNAEAHTARARIQFKAGNVEGAAVSAAEAVKQLGSATPEVKSDALAVKAALDLERGSGKEALAHAQEAVAASPGAASLAVLARAQARLGDPASVETARKAVAAGAQSAAAHEALGHAQLAMQRGDEAAAAFRQALTIEPRRASARAGLAEALVATGKAAAAVTEAKKATEDNDKSGEAFAAYANALYAAAANKQQGWNEAIKEAQQGAFLSPRNVTVLTTVARLFEASGNYDQAATNYRRALEADPGYVPAQLGALEIESRKDPAAALPRVQELARQQPDNAALQYMLGKLLARKGEWADALEPLQKASPALANVAEAQALLGAAYQNTGQSGESLAAFKRAVVLAPNNLDYRASYGLLLGINKLYAEAIAELLRVTNSPEYKYADAWVNLGWVYRNANQTSEATNAYQRALAIEPGNAQAALGLGWAFVNGMQYDPALEAFKKAMTLDAKLAAEAHYGSGWSYLGKNDPAQATAAADRAEAARRNVRLLRDAIARFKPGDPVDPPPPPPPPGPDVRTLCTQLQQGSVAARRSAARQLGRLGTEGADCLVYAVRNDAHLEVRIAAAVALGNLGAAAGRQACVQLQGIVRSANPYCTGMTCPPNEMQDEVRYEDLRREAKAAMAKIGCD